MKIMVACPLGRNTTKNGRDIAKAFIRCGIDVSFFNMDKRPFHQVITPKPLRTNNYEIAMVDYLNQELVKAVIHRKINVLFVVKPVNISADTLLLINRLGVLTCCYWIDDPMDFHRSVINSKHFSLCFTNDKSSIANYKKENINAFHLPSAVDFDTFYPLHKSTKYDFSFVGTHAEYRERTLNKLRYSVSTFGPGWCKKTASGNNIVPNKEVFGKKTNQVYNQSAINLNIHMWNGIGSAMNLRLFEVPASGSFLLSDWVEEIDDYFTSGVNIETWKSIDELNDKAHFYIENLSAREKITLASYEHVKKYHSYDDRCKIIISEISKLL